MKIIDKIKKFFEPPERPEDLFQIEMTDEKLTCTRSDGTIEEITWEELNKIEIHTNDCGPFIEDVYWVLHGNNRGCVIPQGAPDSTELLKRLQDLPGFSNEKFMDAMACTDNNEFLIWEKSEG